MGDNGEARSTNLVKRNTTDVKLLGTYNWEKKEVNVFNFVIDTYGNCTIYSVQDHQSFVESLGRSV